MGYAHRYTLKLPVDAALTLHRDHLPDFAPSLPGVGWVEPTAAYRSPEGHEILEHRWQGDLSAIPRLLRPAIDATAFQWFDHTRWDTGGRRCDWQMRVPVLGEGVRIEGVYTFEPVGHDTEVTVEAELVFAPGADSPMARSALGRRMLPVVERFVRGLFTALMTRSSEVIAAHADRAWDRAQAA